MKFYTLILFIFISISVLGQAKPEINWMTLPEVEQAMKTEKKKVFIDLYTDWCGWCKRMDASTFSDPNVVNYLNQNYYCVKFNAERRDTVEFNNYKFYDVTPTGKRGTNLFAYSVLDGKMSYPSFALLDENFNRVHIISGYKTPEPFMGLMLFFATDEYKNYTNYLLEQYKKQGQTPSNSAKQ